MDSNNKCYIIRQSNGSLCKIFYDENKGIVYKIFKKGLWSQEEEVCQNSINNFYVILGYNDYIYLFCQNKSMDIVQCVYNNIIWSNKIIFFSRSDINYSINIKAAIYKNDIHIFYNIPSNSQGYDVLIHQTSMSCSEWSSPRPVDLLSSNNKNYSVLMDKNSNIIIFYETGRKEFTLGYKKYSINSGIWSEFYAFDKNSFKFKDFSVVLKDNCIHSLYIKDGNCSSSLIYTYKDSRTSYSFTLSNTIKINSCSIFLIDDNIWTTWKDSNGIYGAYSTDNGKEFSIPSLLNNSAKLNPVKVNFLNNDTEINKHLFMNEFYVNDFSSFDVLLIPDIYPPILDILKPESSTYLDESAEHIDSHLNYIKDHLNDLYSKIYLYEKQLQEKEQRISELTYTLEQKNEDILNLQYSIKILREKLDKINKTNNDFELKINNLEFTLGEKSKQIKSISELNTLQKLEIDNLNNSLNNQQNIKSFFIKKFFDKK